MKMSLNPFKITNYLRVAYTHKYMYLDNLESPITPNLTPNLNINVHAFGVWEEIRREIIEVEDIKGCH